MFTAQIQWSTNGSEADAPVSMFIGAVYRDKSNLMDAIVDFVRHSMGRSNQVIYQWSDDEMMCHFKSIDYEAYVDIIKVEVK